MKSHSPGEKHADQILVGIQSVATALKNKASGIARVWVATGSSNQRVRDLALLAADAGIEVREEIRERLDQLAGFERHQDIIAQLHAYEHPTESDLLPLLESVSGDPLVLVLDGVQDPHNLGGLLPRRAASGNFPKRSSGMEEVKTTSSAPSI